MSTSKSAINALPFDNSFARLPTAFYRRIFPEPLNQPYVVAISESAAQLVGIEFSTWVNEDIAAVFAGNQLLDGSEPLAAVYSGHQFGDWAGQLGDGRVHLLGELSTSNGNFELQLKGAGRTPYSRFADGRAVLRSSIREFLCSEAMAALGIPTTRALCVIGSDDLVQRETLETAAVVTRVAESFVRFGSFQHWSAHDREVELKLLADYIIDKFRPALRGAENPYAEFLRDVAKRTGALVAHWQAVGFMHGVMNTDNMSILGLTLDYGPFGFMEAFNAGHICNHSDHTGRYSFRAQPRIAQWNCYALADAMQPLIGHPDICKEIVDAGFTTGFNNTFGELMHNKLGLATTIDSDDEFIADTFALLQRTHVDYTLFFRRLSELPSHIARGDRAADEGLRDLFFDREACDAWVITWRARLQLESAQDTDRIARMLSANPKYILRNWMAEAAIRKARDKDFSEVANVLRCLQQPYAEQPEFEHYAALPPDWASGLEVSCSS
jgi:serine/tyrosine/threonine adenylyltransferase